MSNECRVVFETIEAWDYFFNNERGSMNTNQRYFRKLTL